MSHSEPESFWSARLSSNFSLLGTGNPRLGAGFNRWQYRVRAHVYGRTLRSLGLPDRPSILDVGAGTGFMLETWQRNMPSATIEACDLTRIAVENLSREFPDIVIRQVDITRPETPYGATHDAVSANDVLFHIEEDADYRSAMANLNSALRPGGLLIFTEFMLHGERIRTQQEALRPIGEVTSLLRAEGFEVLQRRPMFVLFNTPVDSNSALLHKWWALVLRLTGRLPRIGGLLGALLYLPEIALFHRLREGPSTELLVARKL